MDERYSHIGEITDRTMEECGELVQAICKLKRFGPNSWHPKDSNRITNKVLVRNEIQDVRRMLDELEKDLLPYGD